jgi:hypothetical protein
MSLITKSDIQECHILIGCADARDLHHAQLEAITDGVKSYRNKGIDIDFHIIRAAGSFVTPDVYMDVKRTIEQNLRHANGQYKENRFYVHIQTHGHLDDTSNKDYISHIYNMNIVANSPLNCGMLHATQVGVEIEQMIIREKLCVETPKGETMLIDEDHKIRDLLREFYAYDGYLAGDWIKSIDYLRTHPRSQRAKLEKLIQNDPELHPLGIQVTAGIQDYSIHALIRLDDGFPKVPFWDDIQMDIRQRVANEVHTLKDSQNQKQKPYAGLISMSDPEMSSRVLAAKYYLKSKGIESEQYMPNTVFNITGSAFDVPYAPFGPYVIAGFYYAVVHLHLTDQMLMGYDSEQTNRILLKVKNDPIMNLIVNTYKVNLIPVTQEELAHIELDQPII